MCTYNGERHLPQQLTSILRQSRLPDQLIIRDDGSTDSTWKLIEKFRELAPFPVDFKVNEKNLGSTRNFEQAILACTGELIALTDQDDVWHTDRLERSEQELKNHPEAGLVFSDADVIDEVGRPLGFSLWENFAFDPPSMEALQAGDVMPLTRRTFITGATVMFRSFFAPICFPTGEHWLHDGWLGMLIACMTSIRPIPEKLISYRFHRQQQVGLGPEIPTDDLQRKASLAEQSAQHKSTVAYFHTILDEICRTADALLLTSRTMNPEVIEVFHRHRDFLAMRLLLPSSRFARLPLILNAIEQYRRSSRGVLSMVKDLVLPDIPK
jgi:glycosyltransferase involved in cell wall biosynthesis